METEAINNVICSFILIISKKISSKQFIAWGGFMVKKTVYFLLFITIGMELAGCGKDNPASVYEKTGKEALLIVVENNNLLESMLEAGYIVYHDQVKSILADVFEVKKNDIADSLPLTEVVDKFGEDWQIRKVTSAAQPYYSRIISLTDAAATHKAVLDSLSDMGRSGFIVDMIINLHGGENWLTGVSTVYFSDGTYDISAFCDSVKTRSIPLRALYQTCCYGASMIPSWEKTGITAVNGASDLNYFVMFSPIYFLTNWTSGMTYGSAVRAAFNAEIEKIKSYQSVLPAISALMTEDVMKGSAQELGGTDSLLLWTNNN